MNRTVPVLTDPKQRTHRPIGEVDQEPGFKLLIRLVLVVQQHRHHLTGVHGPTDHQGEQWLRNERLLKIEILLNGMHHLMAQDPFKVLLNTLNIAFAELNQIRATDMSTHQGRLIAAVEETVHNTHTEQQQKNRDPTPLYP